MQKMQLEHFIVGPVQTNCYFIINKDTKELLVVDPGESGKKLAAIAVEKKLSPVAVLLTHAHFDHVDGLSDFIESFRGEKIPVYAHEEERRTLEDPRINLSDGKKSYHADIFLKDHEKFSLAGFEIEALFTPGHTPGGVCYYFPEEGVLFSGDSLFAGSIGRTDFPEGSLSRLVRSIKEQCLSLPDDTRVFPGHEGYSTIKEEKKYNPFLQ